MVNFVKRRWHERVHDARPYLAWSGGFSADYDPRLVYVDDGTPATLAPGQREPRRANAWRDWNSPEDDARDRPPGLDPPCAVRWEDEAEVRERAKADYVVMQSACPRDGVPFVPPQPLPPNAYPQRWECARTEPCDTCKVHPGAAWHLTGEAWVLDGPSEPPSPPPRPRGACSPFTVCRGLMQLSGDEHDSEASGSGRPVESARVTARYTSSGWPEESQGSGWGTTAPGWSV